MKKKSEILLSGTAVYSTINNIVVNGAIDTTKWIMEYEKWKFHEMTVMLKNNQQLGFVLEFFVIYFCNVICFF